MRTCDVRCEVSARILVHEAILPTAREILVLYAASLQLLAQGLALANCRGNATNLAKPKVCFVHEVGHAAHANQQEIIVAGKLSMGGGIDASNNHASSRMCLDCYRTSWGQARNNDESGKDGKALLHLDADDRRRNPHASQCMALWGRA
jgi:hypothetical protein